MNKYSLKGVIDRFEGMFAVLKLDDGQTLNWPIKNLPDDIKESQSVRLVFFTSQTDDEEREKTAKALLNEILNNN
jgi:hypothetical protein